MSTSILLASPREPSGGSWLVNCLLELGVRVDVKPTVDRAWRGGSEAPAASIMWQAAPDGRWRLHARAEALTKWLPILSQHDTFSFRDDVSVLYVQDLPHRDVTCERTALFVRDPRDAIQSLYRRNRPNMSLQEFARFPHPETLLDAIGHWGMFVESWLAREGTQVYRFEDYKTDADALLSRIASALGLDAAPEEIARAAAGSSYEKARAAEEQYRATHPGDEEVAMRAGQVGEWMDSQEAQALSREIEKRLGPLLTRLGYEPHTEAEPAPEPEAISHLNFLSVFERLDLPPALREAAASMDPMACPRLVDVLEFASAVDAEAIRRAKLPGREARQLLDSLQEYVAAWQQLQRVRTDTARAAFNDGTDYHMERIRALRASRRARDLEP